jgi:hypothetical protein
MVGNHEPYGAQVPPAWTASPNALQAAVCVNSRVLAVVKPKSHGQNKTQKVVDMDYIVCVAELTVIDKTARAQPNLDFMAS